MRSLGQIWGYQINPGDREALVRLRRMGSRALNGDIGELARASAMRLEADRKAPMSARLARVHTLCKQMSAIKGAAKAH